ncbi:1-deoxy-D-xylulose-5-phosphate reductoisomerase [Salsuginibacillus kocurii]|uniref:1-deoxy-D-xylulose-5-phosphate reductoisomerase n=1 Tax=Salsuginibacillus kocurii TaxID=427078 RepID=UPI0003607311|nr:1-deoxy-D-xylulose-5-phosphate reductoisomerase [Salsuginibacillus kocurii]
MKKIALLGSTGSIGTQTLDVVRSHNEQFELVAMSVGRNVALAAEQINEFQPALVSVAEEEDIPFIKERISASIEVMYGQKGMEAVSTHPEATFVMNAVLGSIGLQPTLRAIEKGRTIGIANKETLVTAGHLVMEAADKYGATLLPVDSEHSAIFQCLQGCSTDDIKRLILTASGGTFRDKAREQLRGVTVDEALKHPNWSMGAKITIDSATMMNKGLEVIEAHWLFNTPYQDIDVVLHRESIVHSFVEFKDGNTMAELGHPDMRAPIQFALSWPNRLEFEGKKQLNLWEVGALHFEEMKLERFRCLSFAYEAGQLGGTYPTVLNAANETAVAAFLKKQIEFLEIEDYIEDMLNRHVNIQSPTLEQIIEVDQTTREHVASQIK